MGRDGQLIFGIHAVLEALEAGRDLDRVLVRRGSRSGLMKKLLATLSTRRVPVQMVPVEKLNRMTRKNHQGVVAWASLISYADIETVLPGIYEAGDDPLLLILDSVSDVRNFGAIARSAACAGVHAIVIPESGAAAINADALKTSAGALHRLPVCRHKDLSRVCRFLKHSGIQLVAATEKAEDNLYDAGLDGPLAIVMGSEERGVSHDLLKEADHWLAIPMKGEIASLNVSVACGIMLFEARRQRALGKG